MSILSFFERHRELKKVAKYSARRKEKSSGLSSPTHANTSALSVKIPDAGSGNWKGDAYTQSVSEYYAHTPRSRPQNLAVVDRCAGPASAPPTTAPYNRRQGPGSTSSSSAASSTASSFGRSTSGSSGMSVAEGILIVLADEEEGTTNTTSTTTYNSPNPTFASSSPSLSLRPSSPTTPTPTAVAPPPLPLYTPPPPPLFTPPASSRFEPRSCVSFDESARPHGLARASTMNAGKRNSVMFWKKNADRLDPAKVRSSEDYNSLDQVEYHQR
ncbi:hypothetical protein HDU87_003726 [Geranomyces variabilis]|uniref:Uncharacterized protein n=1 Tax=Geranomyces variabilis TaxID=109894 RepID=A0AAD5TKA9_9FUNG|nr:hypothetical protein HDU87_003726 [Geranomyces variabilis]